jgi:retron-type reverse transcriptase
VAIPKSDGGRRVLRIRNLCDRIVAAALNDALSPYWETVFFPGSMGFRPGRGVWTLLAELEAVMVRADRWVLAIDDIRQAFDNVRIADLLADHRTHVPDCSLLALIEVVLRAGESRERGIDQGSSYSPTALNVRLHHAHDLDLHQDRTFPPWFRYADNLVYLCLGVSEGHQAWEKARYLLTPAGFSLKGKDGPPADRRQGQQAPLLGFCLRRKKDELSYDLGKDACCSP